MTKKFKDFSTLEQVWEADKKVKNNPAPHSKNKKTDNKAEQELFLEAMQGTFAIHKADEGKTPLVSDLAKTLEDLGFKQTSEKHSTKTKVSKNRQRTTLSPSDKQHVTAMQEQTLVSTPPSATSSEEEGFFSPLHGTEEENLFAKATKGVKPMQAKGRDIPKPVLPKSGFATNPDFLSDFLLGKIEFDIRNTEEYTEGFVTGIDPLVLNKLRNGGYSPEAHLDLHGQNSLQAQDSLMIFIKSAYYKNMRTLLIITGRGKNSPNRQGILKADLQEWLTKDPFKRVVLGFCTAKPCDGGAGAMYVLLRKFKKSNGKIRWERAPNTDDFL